MQMIMVAHEWIRSGIMVELIVEGNVQGGVKEWSLVDWRVFYFWDLNTTYIVVWSKQIIVMTTEEKIRALKNKLKECDTESILGNISLTYITQADVDGLIDRKTRFIDSELMSPQKQRLYLAGQNWQCHLASCSIYVP